MGDLATTTLNYPLGRRLRMGLVGGGGQAFIGKVHALAAQLDNRAVLVAGVLSSRPEVTRQSAPALGIEPARAYADLAAMLRAEQALPADQRIDFVSIATPNHTHFEFARAALEAGFHVVCDKPLTTNLADAVLLAELADRSDRVFALTHNYSGYPLVRQARELVAAGELGDVFAVRANYLQGWLWGVDPQRPPARGAWKADPALNGPAGTLGDVGTHAFQLLSFITGLRPRAVQCLLRTVAPHRRLDDYGQLTLRLTNDALATVIVSQVSHGRLNDLTIEVDGTTGSLSWRQEEPNQLTLRRCGEPTRIFERNPAAAYLLPTAVASCRLPAGHPEAFLEAFANIYRDAFDDMAAVLSGGTRRAAPLYPTVQDGVAGMRLLDRALDSHARGGAWCDW